MPESLAQDQGPSSSQSAYLLPLHKEGRTVAVLSAGDTVPGVSGPYRMIGVPDGTGAMDLGDGTFVLLVNHEIGPSAGVERAHGFAGAFVSRWRIDAKTLEVLEGRDLIESLWSWNADSAAFEPATRPLCRLCSADLAPASAYYDSASGLGTPVRIFTNGEECEDVGRAFAHVVTGDDAGHSFELAGCGRMTFENLVASPESRVSTLAIALEDAFPGQLYLYRGQKRASGSVVERAGLMGGSLFGVKVSGVPEEDQHEGVGAGPVRFTLQPFGDVTRLSASALDSLSLSTGVTSFLRPEDGHWDPSHPGHFYFVTTDRFDETQQGFGRSMGRTRVYRLRFDDLDSPESGGWIDTIVAGDKFSINMLDNLTVDRFGRLWVQEDPGSSERNALIWGVDPVGPVVFPVARHDPARFGDVGIPPTPPFSLDEESSGIIDASALLGDGWFIAVVQAHYDLRDAEIVQGGQLVALYDPRALPPAPTGTAPPLPVVPSAETAP